MNAQSNTQITQLMRGGQWAKAEVACRQGLHEDPNNPALLGQLSHCLLRLGQKQEALKAARSMLDQGAPDPAPAIELAQVCFHGGSKDLAKEALATSLSEHPSHAELHLQLGHLLREFGEDSDALTHFACALKLEREASGKIPSNAAFQSATGALDQHFLQLNRQLLSDPALANLDAGARQRLQELVDTTLGVKEKQFQVANQRPSLHYLPTRAPKPFHERDEFEWVAELETKWEVIRDELLAVMAADQGFAPYVDHSGRDDNWAALQGERTWSAFHLFKSGQPVEENIKRCPKTAAILDKLPLARATDHAPEAFFSVIQPGTEIAPHYGLSNTKLAVHLALVIPEDCALKAGGETRTWTEGQCLIFDDSYEHEAWNRSSETRAVMIFDVWNPQLSEADIRVVQGMCTLMSGWFNYASRLDPAKPEPIYQGEEVLSW